DRTIITYFILGFGGLYTLSYGSWLAINDTNGTVGKYNSSKDDGENNTKNNIVLTYYNGQDNVSHSVIIGAGKKTYGKGTENVVIGFNAQSEKPQNVVIG
ncbi:hypothetical protein, partial [Streptobacillus moniliformis]